MGVGAQALTFNQHNQITNPGFIYDAAGNLQMDAQNCYSYDAENRLSSVVPKTYVSSTGLWVCGSPGAPLGACPDLRSRRGVRTDAIEAGTPAVRALTWT